MSQLTLDFNARPTQFRRLVRLSKSDLDFLDTTPLDKLPDSFLLETRAQRLGCTVDELRCMRGYDLARELADETAILGLGDFERTSRIPATLMADEQAKSFQEFLSAQRDTRKVAQ